ncbi:MAG: outer membrane protein assembly factor BamD, partial [Limnohabitans sp.]
DKLPFPPPNDPLVEARSQRLELMGKSSFSDYSVPEAAVNRAQLAITDYPGVPAIKEALEILIKSYDALGMQNLKADAQRVLDKNFPAPPTPVNQKTGSWWKFW